MGLRGKCAGPPIVPVRLTRTYEPHGLLVVCRVRSESMAGRRDVSPGKRQETSSNQSHMRERMRGNQKDFVYDSML